MRDVVVLVAEPSDRVACSIGDRLRKRNAITLTIATHELADHEIVLQHDRFVVDGARVRAMLWRVAPSASLSESFAESDRSFASSECAAAWVAATRNPSLFVANRALATTWYGGAQWPTWRSFLEAHDIPVSRLHFGEPPHAQNLRWIPFTAMYDAPLADDALRAMGGASLASGELRCFVSVHGRPIAAECPRIVRAVAARLPEWGIELAKVWIDREDRVLFLDTVPDIEDEYARDSVVHTLAELLHDAVSTR